MALRPKGAARPSVPIATVRIVKDKPRCPTRSGAKAHAPARWSRSTKVTRSHDGQSLKEVSVDSSSSTVCPVCKLLAARVDWRQRVPGRVRARLRGHAPPTQSPAAAAAPEETSVRPRAERPAGQPIRPHQVLQPLRRSPHRRRRHAGSRRVRVPPQLLAPAHGAGLPNAKQVPSPGARSRLYQTARVPIGPEALRQFDSGRATDDHGNGQTRIAA